MSFAIVTGFNNPLFDKKYIKHFDGKLIIDNSVIDLIRVAQKDAGKLKKKSWKLHVFFNHIWLKN